MGITPACAGKRKNISMRRLGTGDHPRMRGEKHAELVPRLEARGSPPHARGKGFLVLSKKFLTRITPACAGKSPAPAAGCRRAGDHPRMRGEKLEVSGVGAVKVGSPPHARGKVVLHDARPVERGITPAYAGKSLRQLAECAAVWDHPRIRGEKQALLGRRRADGGITPAYAGKSRQCCP